MGGPMPPGPKVSARSAGRPPGRDKGFWGPVRLPVPVPVLPFEVLLFEVLLFGALLLLLVGVVGVVAPRLGLTPEEGCQGIGARQMGQSGSAPAQLFRNCRRQPVWKKCWQSSLSESGRERPGER